jgi:hypothetical protein
MDYLLTMLASQFRKKPPLCSSPGRFDTEMFCRAYIRLCKSEDFPRSFLGAISPGWPRSHSAGKNDVYHKIGHLDKG